MERVLTETELEGSHVVGREEDPNATCLVGSWESSHVGGPSESHSSVNSGSLPTAKVNIVGWTTPRSEPKDSGGNAGYSGNENGLDVEIVYLGYVLLMRRDGGATRRGNYSRRGVGNNGCGRGKVGGLRGLRGHGRGRRDALCFVSK